MVLHKCEQGQYSPQRIRSRTNHGQPPKCIVLSNPCKGPLDFKSTAHWQVTAVTPGVAQAPKVRRQSALLPLQSNPVSDKRQRHAIRSALLPLSARCRNYRGNCRGFLQSVWPPCKCWVRNRRSLLDGYYRSASAWPEKSVNGDQQWPATLLDPARVVTATSGSSSENLRKTRPSRP